MKSGSFLGSGSSDPNIWVLLPFLDPNIGTLLWWKYIKDVIIMWLAWQTWLTQPGKFNLQLQSPSWNYDPNIRMRLDPKEMVQHQVYTPNFDVTYQGQKVDPHFGVQWLIQYFWCVIFRFNPRYLAQTWTWTLWYNPVQVQHAIKKWTQTDPRLKLWSQKDLRSMKTGLIGSKTMVKIYSKYLKTAI